MFFCELEDDMTKTVAEEYAELYHYTTAEGLHGIIKDQYLRATNISFLNDAEERNRYFDKRMPLVLRQAIQSFFDERIKKPDFLVRIEQNGGYEKIVIDTSDELTTKIRKVAYAMDEPYVVSFCGTKDTRIARDGLLSQWRAYGADGGYAIVFDTNELESVLKDEIEKYIYRSRWLLGDVYYYDDENIDASMPEEFQKHEEIIKNSIADFLESEPCNKEKLVPIYDVINQLSCLTKHWGFHEEREVRIVAIRGTETIVKKLRDSGVTRPVRPVHHHSRNGVLVPYIRLFERAEGITGFSDKKLPIKSVIVGPHPDKMRRIKAVDLLLKRYGISAEVTFSDIPYLPG